MKQEQQANPEDHATLAWRVFQAVDALNQARIVAEEAGLEARILVGGNRNPEDLVWAFVSRPFRSEIRT